MLSFFYDRKLIPQVVRAECDRQTVGKKGEFQKMRLAQVEIKIRFWSGYKLQEEKKKSYIYVLRRRRRVAIRDYRPLHY